MNPARVLRWARRRAGLTQRELAEKCGVPQSTVARIEAGLSDPRVSTISALLRACDILLEPADDLTDGVDRSLIRTALEMTPEQRLQTNTNFVAFANELREAYRRARAG